jgi:hypothetical protein
MVKKFHGFLGEPQPMETEWGESKTNFISNNPLVYTAAGATEALEMLQEFQRARTRPLMARYSEITLARLSHPAGHAVIDK